jgi:hypothetical protein
MIHIADTCVDISIGIELQKMGDHELSSSEIDEPVTDDGDAVSFKI